MNNYNEIEFQYFDNCPNGKVTLENLKVAMNHIGLENFKIIKLSSINETETYNFQGSPTVLINGKDAYTLKKPNTTSYSCRMYNIDGKITGILSVEYLISKLREICN